jgi:hypothetical protein
MPRTIYSRTYPEAFKLTTPQERTALANDAFIKAEQMNLQDHDFAVFDEPAKGIRLVVEWGTKTVHILTPDEAKKSNLPPATSP